MAAVSHRCRDCGAQFDGERWQRLCWSCWRESKRSDELADAYHRGYLVGVADRAPALSVDLLRDVISLCHPDRHPSERFELANRTTAQLLEVRRELAA